MTSRLVRLPPDRVDQVRVLAGDIVLCSWVRHFTSTVPLSTQVYKICVTGLAIFRTSWDFCGSIGSCSSSAVARVGAGRGGGGVPSLQVFTPKVQTD